MHDSKNQQDNETAEAVIVSGSDTTEPEPGAAEVVTQNKNTQNSFAKTYVLVSFGVMALLGVIFPIILAIVWAYLGPIPLSVFSTVNLIILPFLLAKRLLHGVYILLGILLLVISFLAFAGGIYYVAHVRSTTNQGAAEDKELSEYYNQMLANKFSEVTVEQATQLINDCRVTGLYYRLDTTADVEGSSTGILISKASGLQDDIATSTQDYTGKYRMNLADGVVDTIVPIARSAQSTCYIQFGHDGMREYYKDGKWYFRGQVMNDTNPGITKDEAISFLQSCKADYFVGYMDISLVKDNNARGWLERAEKSTSGILISDDTDKSYVFTSKTMTVALENEARGYRQSCYATKKLYIMVDDWVETEYPIGTWTKVQT